MKMLMHARNRPTMLGSILNFKEDSLLEVSTTVLIIMTMKIGCELPHLAINMMKFIRLIEHCSTSTFNIYANVCL